MNKLKNILRKDLDIPLDDVESWLKYPKYNWVYNKINICKYQNLTHAPMPIKPKKYPVILKPIINLYGMGLNTIKLENDDDFNNNWHSNSFWMEYLKGNHLSWDLIILKGKNQFYTCFKGIKDKKILGKFDYWVSIDKKLPNIIKKFINDKFKLFSGCLNIETIGGKMIEAHLRMGDIQKFPNRKLFEGIVKTYQKKVYNWDKVKLNQIYFYPVWSKENLEEKYRYKLYYYLKDIIPRLLEKDNFIFGYRVDHPTLGNPSGDNRLMWFTCGSKKYAEKLRSFIYDQIEIFKKYK